MFFNKKLQKRLDLIEQKLDLVIEKLATKNIKKEDTAYQALLSLNRPTLPTSTAINYLVKSGHAGNKHWAKQILFRLKNQNKLSFTEGNDSIKI